MNVRHPVLWGAAALGVGMALGGWWAHDAPADGQGATGALQAASLSTTNSSTPATGAGDAHSARGVAAVPAGFQRALAAHRWVSSLSVSQFEAAFTAVTVVPDIGARRLLGTVYYRRFVDLDPKAAFVHFEGNLHAGDPLYVDLLASLIDTWLDRDAAAASAQLATLPDLRMRQRVARRVLAARDPEAASSAALMALLNADDRDALRLDRQLAQEPAQAFHQALKQPAGALRSSLLREAFMAWVLAEPAQALGQIDRIPPAERQEVASAALAALAEQQPQRVLGLMQHVTETPNVYLGVALGVVARKSPREALDWLRQNAASRDPDGSLLTAMIPGLAEHSPAMAAEALTSMKERATTQNIQLVAVAMARQDPRAAQQWMQSFTQGRSQRATSRVINGFGASWAATQPEQAAAYLSQVSEPGLRGTLIREISANKGQEDLRGAWQWLSQYSTEPAYAESARNLLYRWSHLKPQEVAALLPQVARGDVQSAAAEQLAMSWKQQDATAYNAWIASLPDGSLKSAASR
jgi:hypothetical protein